MDLTSWSGHSYQTKICGLGLYGCPVTGQEFRYPASNNVTGDLAFKQGIESLNSPNSQGDRDSRWVSSERILNSISKSYDE